MHLSEMLETGRFYRWEEEQPKPCEMALQHKSKLSLFHSSHDNEQSLACFSLLKNYFPEAIFQYVQSDQGIVWNIFDLYQTLQATVTKQLSSFSLDYLLWPELCHEAPRLLLFDMDSTFITIEVIDELAKRHNVGEKVARVTEAAMQGELDFAQSLIARVACLKGLSEKAIFDIAQALPISPGVEQLVSDAAKQDCAVAIVSGGFTPFVEKLKVEMGLYQVHANRLAIADGVLSGEVEGTIVDASAKADFLYTLCDALHIKPGQAMAIGDGANDLLMMQAAGFNLAYKAKPKVQLAAKGRINQTHLGMLSSVFGWVVE